MKKVAYYLSALFILLLLLGSVPVKAQESVLTYGVDTTPTGVFNPILSDSVYDSMINSFVYDSLLFVGEDLEMVEQMAESYEMSEDQLTLTFILKEDLMWSDGEPITTQDIAFTFNSMAHPDFQGANYGQIELLEGAKEVHEGEANEIKGIEIVNEREIHLHFIEPYAPAVTNIGLIGIIPQHIWSEIPMTDWKNVADMKTFIGSGPYVLDEFEDGQYVKFHANPHYNKEVATDNLIVKVVNADSALSELMSEEVDILNVSNLKEADKEQLRAEDFEIMSHENPMLQVMGVNMTSDLLQDTHLRKAMIQAINREGMVEALLEGNGQVVNTTILTSSWAYPGDENLEAYPFSVETAIELLETNGYEYADGILSKDGEPIVFHLINPTGNEMREKSAQLIQQNLKQIGIEIIIDSMEFPAMMDVIFAEEKDYDLFLMGSNQPVDPDVSAYWHTDGPWNMTGYSNSDVDQLLEEGKRTTDIEMRKEVYGEFAKILNDELPFIFLYSQNVDIAVNPKVSNYDPTVFRDFSDSYLWTID